MLIRRETPADVPGIGDTVRRAFAQPDGPAQALDHGDLVDVLRAGDAWLPALSMVAEEPDGIVGHVVCTRASVGGEPVLILGPLAVVPEQQRTGVGSALVHAVLGAADALDEPLVALLGSPVYYGRFGFRDAAEFGISPRVAAWLPYFQVRPLAAYRSSLRGEFHYAVAFDKF
ncbi:MAG TPA: N-acetyltransferase [Pseudonocardiaceae bacterium]|nr:N-acetyltransferase [Pseudonocardiaceae bacterium]